MSKSDKQNNRGAVASRSECAYKTLDNERRLIDDLIQTVTFSAKPVGRLGIQNFGLFKNLSVVGAYSHYRPQLGALKKKVNCL